MTVDGGEDISDELARLTQPKLNYAKIYAFGMFVLLAHAARHAPVRPQARPAVQRSCGLTGLFYPGGFLAPRA